MDSLFVALFSVFQEALLGFLGTFLGGLFGTVPA
jgi:hypothetical protein